MNSTRRVVARVGGASIALLLGLTACQTSIAAFPMADSTGRSGSLTGKPVISLPAQAARGSRTQLAIRRLESISSTSAGERDGARAQERSSRSKQRNGQSKKHPSQAGRVVDVTGGWQELGGVCVPTGVNGTVVSLHCPGGVASAEGGWTGVFQEEVWGNLDLLTGDIKGTSKQTFTGRSADGGVGTISMDEDFTIDGASGAVHGVATITGGTGDFAGSSGHYEAYGFNPAVGAGGYAAHWIRP